MKNIFIRDDNQILKGLEGSKDSTNLTIFAKEERSKGRVKIIWL